MLVIQFSLTLSLGHLFVASYSYLIKSDQVIQIKTHGSESRPSKVGRATTMSYLHEQTILIERL